MKKILNPTSFSLKLFKKLSLLARALSIADSENLWKFFVLSLSPLVELCYNTKKPNVFYRYRCKIYQFLEV